MSQQEQPPPPRCLVARWRREGESLSVTLGGETVTVKLVSIGGKRGRGATLLVDAPWSAQIRASLAHERDPPEVIEAARRTA